MIFLPWHLAAAYILDLAAGDPGWLPHPIRWIGRLVTQTENLLYADSASPALMRVSGFALWAVMIAVVLGSAETFIVSGTQVEYMTWGGVSADSGG